MTVTPIENTVGLYYERVNDIKISSDQWNLLVYKDLSLITDAYEKNELILTTLNTKLHQEYSSTKQLSFALSLRSHFKTLYTISSRIGSQLRNIQLETPLRHKRGILNGIGTIWKAITGNLDASDGEYFNQCIDKLEKDDAAVQALLKSQINIVSTTIKNFNNTVRNLQVDEKTLNQDLENIQFSINNATDERQLLKNKLRVINIFENLLESYVLIESELNDVIESLTFSKLKILHPSVIKSHVLVEQLTIISRLLEHNKLPLNPTFENLPSLINLITLKAFQTNRRLVYILQIPLVSNEQFTTYHLYSLPTKDLNSNSFHAIIPESKYIGLSKDNRQYLRFSNLNSCNELGNGVSICNNMVPLAVEDPPCELEIITKLSSKNCKPVMMQFEDYNIIRLKENKWIIIVSHTLPIVHTCPEETTKTLLLKANSILSMKPKCTAYIGSTQIFAQEQKSSNYSDTDVIPEVPFECCEEIVKNMPITLSPIKLNNLHLDELNTAAHKLKEQEDMLNHLSQESFGKKYLGTFTILTVVFTSIMCLYCCCFKCKLLRRITRKWRPNDDPSASSCCTQIFNYCSVSSPVSKRHSYRTSMHSLEGDTYKTEAVPLTTLTTPVTNISGTSRKSTHTSRKF